MLFSHARRAAAAVAITALAVLFVPAPAGAKIIELGQTTATPGEPDCPGVSETDRCNAITRTTGYQVKDSGNDDVFLAPRDGRIVAWTIGLSDPTANETDFFEASFGGAARAGISVLQQQEKGSTVNEVVANSAIRNLTPYFGKRVQFPLAETLPIEKGQRVGLTVPTWAPAFVDGLKKTTWRAGRAKVDDSSCADYSVQSALLGVGASSPFQCFYTTARLTYSVTIITEPRPAKKKRDKGKDEPQV